MPGGSLQHQDAFVFFFKSDVGQLYEGDFINTINNFLLHYRYNKIKKLNKPRRLVSSHIRERPVKRRYSTIYKINISRII